MGKFAATYDLPAGEQLLVVVHHGEDGQVMQLATEIHGQVVTAEIQLCEPGAFDDEQLAALHEARNNIDNRLGRDGQGIPPAIYRRLLWPRTRLE